MSLLLKNALVLDSQSPANGKRANVLIEEGVISSLNGKSAKMEVDLDGKSLTPGWFDLNGHFNDPGLEHKEDIISGSKTAANGGFTDVCLIPATFPALERKNDIVYVKKRCPEIIDLHVIGALSEKLEGENLTEILDLHDSGAVAFSDGDKPIWNTELLLKALQYTHSIGTPIIQNARDKHLSLNTHTHEGKVSTHLGLRGEPSLSEELIIMRDLEILKYSGGRIHFTKLSSKGGVELVKQAKKSGLSVTADVSLHHLLFTDESIQEFDTVYKNLPAFRAEEDRKALIHGVKSGVIDAICSNHRPQDQESKQLEFDLSEPGSISLQTFASCFMKLTDQLPMEVLIDKVTHGPRGILGFDKVVIKEGAIAKLTVLDESEEWILNRGSNSSKSTNSPFWGAQLKGRVVGTVNGIYNTLNQ